MKTLLNIRTRNHELKVIYNPHSTGMMLSSWRSCKALQIYFSTRRAEHEWVTTIKVIRLWPP